MCNSLNSYKLYTYPGLAKPGRVPGLSPFCWHPQANPGHRQFSKRYCQNRSVAGRKNWAGTSFLGPGFMGQERKNMNQIDTIIKDLKALGDPRAVAIWKRVGMNTDKFFGVALGKLKTYAKKHKKNHELALALWESGYHDARLLATLIEEPKKATEKQIDQWVADCDFWDLNNKLCSEVIVNTPYAQKKIDIWLKSKKEMVRRAGYMTIVGLAKAKNDLPDSYFEPYLTKIEKEIAKEDNWVREAMNYVLIYVGGRNKSLSKTALKAAETIGKVEIDYGESSCQAPDAVAYIKKAQEKL
jgi:3-methyladenine DNA glycosylase AlkD